MVFDKYELELFSDSIVNPVLATQKLPNGAHIAVTDYNPEKNKCPFLRKDYKCNIYHNRPEVCRLYAEIPELKCKFRK